MANLLHDKFFQIRFKRGLAANITDTATVNSAQEAEPHWTIDTKRLYVFDGTANKGVMMESTAGVPSSASDPGESGEMAYDGNYLYVCIATDTWVRAAVATW